MRVKVTPLYDIGLQSGPDGYALVADWSMLNLPDLPARLQQALRLPCHESASRKSRASTWSKSSRAPTVGLQTDPAEDGLSMEMQEIKRGHRQRWHGLRLQVHGFAWARLPRAHAGFLSACWARSPVGR